jgi:toluene monooxygenase electron transfer component
MRVQVNARNRAYEFEAQPGEKVLYAGLRARIDLPYECGTGTCGTCKARLVEGRVIDGWAGAPGKKYLKGGGEFLMCQCAAETDVVAEVPSFVHAADPGASPAVARRGVITASRMLTHDVAALEIALDRAVDFDAGQFMVMAAPGVPGYRAYSMVNYQREARSLDFVIKKKPGGGVSEWLFGAGRDGVAVDLVGPLGKATFYPALGKNILCIAGGSGIAGMMSILARAAQERYFERYRGDVYFGVRAMRDAFYLRELAALRERCGPRLAVTVALSDEEMPEPARREHPALAFEPGLVHEVAARGMRDRYENVLAYVAGPPPAVDAALRMLLLEAKLTTNNIRYDKFS